jgi:tetratricopeptide (TPR) repeat protein
MNRLSTHHPLHAVAIRLESAVAKRDLEKLRLCLIGYQFPSLSREGEDPADVIWTCISRAMQPEPEWLDLLADQLAEAQVRVTEMLADLVNQSAQMVANASISLGATDEVQGSWQLQESYVYNLHHLSSCMPARPKLFAALKGFEKLARNTSSLEFILKGRIPHTLQAALVVQQTDNSLVERWFGEIDSVLAQDPLLARQDTHAQVLQSWRSILWSPDVLDLVSPDQTPPMQRALQRILDSGSLTSSSLLQSMLEMVPKVHAGQAHAWQSFFTDSKLWPVAVQEIAEDLWPADPRADKALHETALQMNWWRLFSTQERNQIRQMLAHSQAGQWGSFWVTLFQQQPQHAAALRAIQSALKSLHDQGVHEPVSDQRNWGALQAEDRAYEREDSALSQAEFKASSKSRHQQYLQVQSSLARIETTLNKRQWDSAHTQCEQLLKAQQASQTSSDLLSKTAASLATLWQVRGHLQEARLWWEQAQQFNPNDPLPFNGLADTFQSMGQHSEAKTLYRQTVDAFPGNVVARNGLANTLQAMGKHTEAESLYRQTVDAFPGDVVARCGLANTLQAMGQHTEAETLYRQTVDAFPGNVVARCGLADTLQAMGQHTEAETLYRQTVDAFPGDVVARNALANLLRKQGRLSEAKQTLKAQPKGNNIHDQVVWALIEASEHEFVAALQRLNTLAQQPMPFKEQEKLKRLVVSMHLRAGQYTLAQAQADQLIVRVKEQANATDLLRMHVSLLNNQTESLREPESMTRHESLFFKKLQTYAQDFQALAANDELYELEYDMLLAA